MRIMIYEHSWASTVVPTVRYVRRYPRTRTGVPVHALRKYVTYCTYVHTYPRSILYCTYLVATLEPMFRRKCPSTRASLAYRLGVACPDLTTRSPAHQPCRLRVEVSNEHVLKLFGNQRHDDQLNSFRHNFQGLQ